jgi:hypothetical protein
MDQLEDQLENSSSLWMNRLKDRLKDSLNSLQTDRLENSNLRRDRLEERFTLWIDQLKDSMSVVVVVRENRLRTRHQLLQLVVAIGRKELDFICNCFCKSFHLYLTFVLPFAWLSVVFH